MPFIIGRFRNNRGFTLDTLDTLDAAGRRGSLADLTSIAGYGIMCRRDIAGTEKIGDGPRATQVEQHSLWGSKQVDGAPAGGDAVDAGYGVVEGWG